MNIIKSAFGFYEVSDNPDSADAVSGHSFGTVIGPGSVNRSTAELVLANAQGRPIIVDRMLANASPIGDEIFDHIVEGPITNAIGQGVGTWGALQETAQFMQEHALRTLLMFGHAHHIGRMAMQAKKLGIVPVLPAGLPRHFDKESTQFGTDKLATWVLRETLGSVYLRIQGRL